MLAKGGMRSGAPSLLSLPRTARRLWLHRAARFGAAAPWTPRPPAELPRRGRPVSRSEEAALRGRASRPRFGRGTGGRGCCRTFCEWPREPDARVDVRPRAIGRAPDCRPAIRALGHAGGDIQRRAAATVARPVRPRVAAHADVGRKAESPGASALQRGAVLLLTARDEVAGRRKPTPPVRRTAEDCPIWRRQAPPGAARTDLRDAALPG